MRQGVKTLEHLRAPLLLWACGLMIFLAQPQTQAKPAPLVKLEVEAVENSKSPDSQDCRLDTALSSAMGFERIRMLLEQGGSRDLIYQGPLHSQAVLARTLSVNAGQPALLKVYPSDDPQASPILVRKLTCDPPARALPPKQGTRTRSKALDIPVREYRSPE